MKIGLGDFWDGAIHATYTRLFLYVWIFDNIRRISQARMGFLGVCMVGREAQSGK